jgi:hypothetical protein
MNFKIKWPFSNKDVKTKAAVIQQVDNELKKNENIEIFDIENLMTGFNTIQDLLDGDEQNVLSIFDDSKKEVYNRELIEATADEFARVVKDAHIFEGKVAGLVNTCKVAIKIDKDIKSKIKSSKSISADLKNKEIELEDIKTLTKDEIKLLDDAGELLKYMRNSLTFLGKFPKLEKGVEDKEDREQFKDAIKTLEGQFSRVNTNILKAKSTLGDIDRVLKNIVTIIEDVDRRFQITFAYSSKRIIKGEEYRPSNPSGL